LGPLGWIPYGSQFAQAGEHGSIPQRVQQAVSVIGLCGSFLLVAFGDVFDQILGDGTAR
jgi:hypothetical protein